MDTYDSMYSIPTPLREEPAKIQVFEKGPGLFPKFRKRADDKPNWHFFIPPKNLYKPTPSELYDQLRQITQNDPILKLLMAKFGAKPLSIQQIS